MKIKKKKARKASKKTKNKNSTKCDKWQGRKDTDKQKQSLSLMLCPGDYVKRMEADLAPELMIEQPDGQSGGKNTEIKGQQGQQQ